ncbi:MAG: DUF3134 family protein [Acaryochloridaceae cyanobacterium SU_2_1]|nr:DUF3134 family protein [Acaryochloridaceae cyanobacterium SU_2_1]
MVNPSLISENRKQVTPIIAPRKNTSLYDWLEANGRFIHRDDPEINWSLEDDELLRGDFSGDSEADYVDLAA